MGDETALGTTASNVLVWGDFGAVRKTKGPFCCFWAGREQETPWTNLAGRNGGCFLSPPAE